MVTRRAARPLWTALRSYSDSSHGINVTVPALLRAAVPLVGKHGFTTEALIIASRSLTSNGEELRKSTIDALFPSSVPLYKPSESLSRTELIREARDGALEDERPGPARALLDAWLRQARYETRDELDKMQVERQGSEAGTADEALVKTGLLLRLRKNEPVLEHLADALPLLATPTPASAEQSTALHKLAEMIALPQPSGYLSHVAHTAHEIARGAGDRSQSLDWYKVRARIGVMYGMAELYLISPSVSALPIESRLPATEGMLARLLDRDESVRGHIEGTSRYLEWSAKSAKGLARSFGLAL